MDPLPPPQHLDELPQAPLAGLGPLCVVQPVDDRVAVGAVERLEALACRPVPLQLALEVGRDLGPARRLIRLLPAPGPGRDLKELISVLDEMAGEGFLTKEDHVYRVA